MEKSIVVHFPVQQQHPVLSALLLTKLLLTTKTQNTDYLAFGFFLNVELATRPPIAASIRLQSAHFGWQLNAS